MTTSVSGQLVLIRPCLKIIFSLRKPEIKWKSWPKNFSKKFGQHFEFIFYFAFGFILRQDL